jgi:hypothetical protein
VKIYWFLSGIREALTPSVSSVLSTQRQMGKTKLAKDLIDQVPFKSQFIDADVLIYHKAPPTKVVIDWI